MLGGIFGIFLGLFSHGELSGGGDGVISGVLAMGLILGCLRLPSPLPWG